MQSVLQYKHGIDITETTTSVSSPVKSEGALAVVVGVAPVHRLPLGAAVYVNKPKLIYTLEEFETLFGKPTPEDDIEKFTLYQFAYAYFMEYEVTPFVAINVFDPQKHFVEQDIPLPADLQDPNSEETVETLKIPDPSKITTDDIIGYVNNEGDPGDRNPLDSKRSGLGLVNEIYPLFGLNPGVLLAPKWSKNISVAKAIKYACSHISGNFRAMGVIEVADSVSRFDEVAAWVNTNNLRDTSGNLICMFGDFANNGRVEPGSIHVAGCIAKRDTETSNIPYWTPSNMQIEAEAMVHNGEQIALTSAEAEYLNSQGIVTALNYAGSLKLWGNETTAYPEMTDPQKASIPVRRMFNYVSNTLVLTTQKFIDMPIKQNMLQTVQTNINYQLDTLKGLGAIIDGRCTFETSDNPTANLLAGHVVWHIYMTPPNAAKHITFTLEYDPQPLNNLFS